MMPFRISIKSICCRLAMILLTVSFLCPHPGQADFSHIKHKIRLKKLAKLALAAKFLAPTIIPIPIPLPIIKHQKHRQEQYKVIKFEDDPWKGGWNYGGSGGGGGGGWHIAHSAGGWAGGHGSADWDQGGFGGWDQGLGRHLEKVEIREEVMPFHGGQGGGFGGQRLIVNEVGHNAAHMPWMGGGIGSAGYHNNDPHQIEVREEILPALKAAGFIEGPDGELTKMGRDDAPAGDHWAYFSSSGAPHGRHVAGGSMQTHQAWQQGWHADMRNGGFGPTQTAEVLETKEVGHARIVDARPFEVENAKLGGFDVSDVPVQAMQAPPVKSVMEMDPWPENVASPLTDTTGHASNKVYSAGDHEPTGDSHLRAVVGHLNSGDPHTQALRDHLNSDASSLHRNHEIEDNLDSTEVANHGSNVQPGDHFQDAAFNKAEAEEDEQRAEGSNLRVGVVRGVPHAGLKPLHDHQPTRYSVLTNTDGWRPLVVSHDSNRRRASRTSNSSTNHNNYNTSNYHNYNNSNNNGTKHDGKQDDAEKWLDAHRRRSR